jgi:hypothetical protein
MDKEYLGDGVYVRFDGYQIWLETQQGMAIALEPPVFAALVAYVKRLQESLPITTP